MGEDMCVCVCVRVVNRHGSLLFGLIKKLLGAKGHTPVNHRPEPGRLSQTEQKVGVRTK